MNYDVSNSKRIGFVALLIVTILLASCPPPTPTIDRPDAPLNLYATAGTTSVTLTWNAVTTLSGNSAERRSVADSYRVYRDGTRIVTTTDIIGTTYTDETVAADVTYRYTVRAVADGVESDDSIVVMAGPGTLPAAPINLNPLINNRDVTLAWPVVADATSYRVYRAVDGAVAMLIETVTPVNPAALTVDSNITYTETIYTDNTAGTPTYTYTVRAVDSKMRESIDSVPEVIEFLLPP